MDQDIFLILVRGWLIHGNCPKFMDARDIAQPELSALFSTARDDNEEITQPM